MSMTIQEWKKLDAAAKNGFRFDTERWGIWNEKRIIKEVPTAWGMYEIIIEYINTARPWEQARIVPVLSVHELHETNTEKVYSVHYPQFKDGTHYKELGEAVSRKNYKNLCKYSETIDTDKILQEVM